MANVKRQFARPFFAVAIILGISLAVYLLYGKQNQNIKIVTPQKQDVAGESTNPVNQADLNQTITDVSKALLLNPQDAESYIKKSEAQYALGQKDAALKTVEEGLKIAPDNELLKSRRDVLLNTFTADPNQITPKE